MFFTTTLDSTTEIGPPNFFTPPLVLGNGAALRSIDVWTAFGLDPFSARILKPVLEEVPGALPGETGSEIFCAVAQHFLDGDIPASVMPLFAAAQVLATPKSNGRARPIAIGTTNLRAILKALIRKDTPVAGEYLAPLQLAAGVKSGCDLVAHEFRAATRNLVRTMAASFSELFRERL
jgi:hypothetical protein